MKTARIGAGTLLAGCLALSWILGCGEGEGGRGIEFVGYYQIQSKTENTTPWGEEVTEDKCLEEGEIDDTAAGGYLLVQHCVFELFGMSESYMQAIECYDKADCEASKCTKNHLTLGGHTFQGGNDKDGWTGTSYALSSFNDEPCEGWVAKETMVFGEDDTITIETREYVPDPYEPDADGFCDDAEAEKTIEGKPCRTYEVIRAARVDDIDE